MQLTWFDMVDDNNLAKLLTNNQNTNMTMQWCTSKTYCIQALAKRLESHVTKVPQKPVFKRQWKGSVKTQAWSTSSKSKFLSSSFVQKLLQATNQLEHKGDRNREGKKGEGEKSRNLDGTKRKKANQKNSTTVNDGANNSESSRRRRNAKP